MADWAALRRRAFAQHLKLRELCGENGHPLIPSDALLKAAERDTGIAIQALPADDPLLAGAQAFLDRDSGMIWYGAGPSLSSERQRFAQAHEFAHFWLHPDIERHNPLPDDSPRTYMGSAQTAAAQLEEGDS